MTEAALLGVLGAIASTTSVILFFPQFLAIWKLRNDPMLSLIIITVDYVCWTGVRASDRSLGDLDPVGGWHRADDAHDLHARSGAFQAQESP